MRIRYNGRILPTLERPAPSLVTSTPIFFPTSPEAAPSHGVLFGWTHLPAHATRDAGIVLVPTLGEEYMMAYQALRGLAEQLAAAGFPVLRIDLHGTGNSSGDDRDESRLDAWKKSVDAAIDRLKADAHVSRVAVFGVRFGAALALEALSTRGDVASAVIAYAQANGRALAREVKAFHALSGRTETDPEWAGFLFTKATMESLGKFEPLARELNSSAGAKKVHVIQRDDRSPDDRLPARLKELGAEVTEVTTPGIRDLTTAPHKSRLPTELYAEVVRAFDVLHPRLENGGAKAATGGKKPSPTARVVVAPNVEEEFVTFGNELRGVYASPAKGDAKGAVLFLNTSANHHVGPSRMYVRFARQLAASGIASLRFDLSLLGDSGSRARAALPDEIYSLGKVPDAKKAIAFLKEHGHEDVILAGLCSGAFTSFHTALEKDVDVKGIFLVNTQVFVWRDGDSLDVGHSRNFEEVDRYKRGVFELERWKKLLRGDVPLGRIAKAFADRAAIRGEAALGQVLARARGQRTIADQFRELVLDRSIAVKLVYATHDPGIDYLKLHVGRLISRLEASSFFNVTIVPEGDHVFSPYVSQERLGELLLGFANETFAKSAAMENGNGDLRGAKNSKRRRALGAVRKHFATI